jgi:predicted ester cyclase
MSGLTSTYKESSMTEPAHNVAIIHTYLQQAVAQGDLEILDRLCEPDIVSYGINGWEPMLGLESQRRFIRVLHFNLVDIRVTIEDIIAADEKVAVRFILSGTPKSAAVSVAAEFTYGGRVAAISHAIYHFIHGRIRESWTTHEVASTEISSMLLGIGIKLRMEENIRLLSDDPDDPDNPDDFDDSDDFDDPDNEI